MMQVTGSGGRSGALIRTLFLVPELDNDGTPFEEAAWLELEERLITQFHGYSRRSGIVGAWHTGECLYQDLNREYSVALISWRQLPVWLAIVEWVLSGFAQEAIYIEVAGVAEILLNA